MTISIPKVSIIIPTYNVEEYLRECLDSVVNQTLKEIEIIAVDDGATDNSGKILDEYAQKDSRIKVIHKENGGYGKAMNVGLDNATGEYIGIVEPDDFVDHEMFETLYKTAKKHDADFVKENYQKYTTKTNENILICVFDKSDIYDKVITPINIEKTFKGSPSIWSAIYKKEFLTQHKIRFNETPGASFQDTSFWLKVLLCSARAMFIKDAHLHYRCDNENSSVKDAKKIFCIVDEFNEIDKFKKGNLSEKEEKIINSVKLEKYRWNLERLTPEAQKQFIEHTKEDIKKIINNQSYNLNIINPSAINYLKNLYQIYIKKQPRKKLSLLQKIFSIKKSNDKKYKIVHLFGLRIKFKRKKFGGCSFWEHLLSIKNSKDKRYKIIRVCGLKVKLRNSRFVKKISKKVHKIGPKITHILTKPIRVQEKYYRLKQEYKRLKNLK